MKQEEGMVLETHDGMARIRVGRHAECVSCGACAGARNVTVDAVNRMGARPGQHVKFEFRETNMLRGAFVVFILPLLAAAAGAALGWKFGVMREMASVEQESLQNPAVGGAVLFFLLSLFGVRAYDRRTGRDREMKPVIVEIMETVHK